MSQYVNKKAARRWLPFLFVVALLVSLILVSNVLAVHDDGLFEIDDPADAIDSSGPGLPDDWDNVYAGTDNSIQSLFITDGSGKEDDIFTTGGSKDIQDVSEWLRSTGNVPDKDDILHAFAAAYTDNGDLIVYFGADRKANNGDAQIGFWFFKDEVGIDGDSGFTGEHKIGDLLVISNFIGGGDTTNIQIYEWAGADGIGGYPELLGEATQEGGFRVCTIDDTACAATNAGGDLSPWPYDPKFGDPGFFPEVSLFEGGVNFAALLGEDIGCFSSFLAETRASQSIDAVLKDYALGAFSLCDLAVVKSGDLLSKVGDEVNYTITISNTGAIRLWKQSIVDDVLGDLTGNAGCGAYLDPGDVCTINVGRTVLDTDPDPLVNTVQVIYNSSAGLLGDEVSRSDDHSVNLFQPAIAVAKTGDELSKVGDEAVYSFTFSNNSSADTPALNCTATDDVLGTVFDGVLPMGDTFLGASRVVQPGDPDPLVNTVTLTCSPEGFPNVLEESASHSTNLFQPAIAVAKTGDALSKVGDSVDYTFTLSNNSSADTPDLDCTAVDTLFGTIFDGDLPLGDTVINRSRTVLDTDPDPLDNTVTLTCSPEGFPNVLEASDDHSVNLFQPAIAVDKTGDELSKVGDDVNYTFTLSNNSSADTPDLDCTAVDTLFGTIFDGDLPLGDTVIYRSRTVLDTDPDPLANTVTLTCSPDGFPNVLEAVASHETNLFQPSITFDKSGDPLSKVGDEVSYTLTLANTSSADTPDMDCTITDAMLGFSKSVTLASGASDVTNAGYIVQDGDPDPLDNSASASCSPQGFPNVLDASDGHSVNLFQPAVEVIKTGPGTAARGETITYFFTINNLSSDDSPNLILDGVTDTVMGDLTSFAAAGGCGSLGYGGSCNFSVDYTIGFGDPSPLVNVVTVHYHPLDFPNDITDDDDHTVLIPIQGCTPGFWQGGAGAPLWDGVPTDPDPDWTGAGTNPYIHTTLFNGFFNIITDPRLNGFTMYQLVSSGGGSDPAIKAARDMVAAYLNESAFPQDFPADSLADLLTMWYNAVAGGDAALNAFHNTVSGWNDPAPPGYCPLP